MAKKYYICVTPFFPTNESIYGSYIYDQVKAISINSDYKVLVFRPTSLHNKSSYYEYSGIKVYLFPSLFMPSYFLNGLTNSYNERTFVSALKKNGIDLNDIAVIHCHTASFACFATAIKKKHNSIKTIVQYHDPDPYQVRNGKLASWKPNAMYRANKLICQFKYIDLHVCISEKVKYNLINFPEPHPQEYFQSYKDVLHLLRCVKTKTNINSYVLYNGVDVSQFHPIPQLKNSTSFQIGCIGNFIDWKDQITLLKAINSIKEKNLIPRMRVRLIGHGPLESELRNYVLEHQLDKIVSFEKEVDHSELPLFYNSLDLFVLPSYFEGFGCVFTEAAACGIPFIMCKGQGAAEYIPESDAAKWLIEKGDSVSLAEKIYDYYINRYEQKLSKSFNINELIKEYLRIIIA